MGGPRPGRHPRPMDTTTPPAGRLPRRPSSTGPVAATWVAGTGAFLLVAAAAVFVGVRWDRLPEAAKLALVGAVTGAVLAGGHALRRSLPATGGVLFHLGAFLLPVDLAGMGMRAGVGWRAIVVSEGVLGVAVLGGLAAASGSVVLGWAATTSMVVLALGLAAVTPLPAAVVLAAAAVAAHLGGARRQALAWSSAAALGPVLGFAATAVVEASAGPGAGVLAALGVEGGVLALLGCLAGAAVAAREARERGQAALAALALAGGGAGLAVTWAGAGIPGSTTLVALPAAFLVVEVVAALCDRDPFWRPLARCGAAVAEVGAGVVGGAWTLGLVVAAPIVETGFDLMSDVPGWEPRPGSGASLAVLAGAWVVAGARRGRVEPALATVASTARGALGHPVTGALAAVAAVAAVEVGTASGPATAVALAAAGAALVWTATPAGLLAGAAAAAWAPMAVATTPGLALPAGLAGAGIVAWGAAAGAGASSWRGRALTALAVGTAAVGSALASPFLGDAGALTAFVLQAWLLAAVVDGGDPVAGDVARAGIVAGVALALAAPETGAGVLAAAAATVLLAADAVRLGRPRVGVAAAFSLQALVALLALAARFDQPETGLVLVLAAVVWAGLAAVVDDAWRPPFLAAAGMGVVTGLALASADPVLLAHALIVSGGLVVAAGVAAGHDGIAHVGGAGVVLGIFGHLDAASVTALEPYVAPVAAHLTLVGWRARRTRALGSWVAYGPAVALLGGAALAERVAGGPGWHAVVAGGVGVAAVAAGGWRRLAGPLFLGTGLVVAVTLVESLGALAGVPTWGWLAAGGSALLAVGVALERADTTPAEAGRRLVDVIAERFE